jgi:hypothetical protein
MSPKIIVFSKNETLETEQKASEGLKLCQMVLNTSNPICPALLDKAFLKICEHRGKISESNDELAESLGAYFGRLLKKEFNMSWHYIDDEYGREKALIDEKSGSVIFPVNSVLKRLEGEGSQEPFFEMMFEAVKKHLNFLDEGVDN